MFSSSGFKSLFSASGLGALVFFAILIISSLATSTAKAGANGHGDETLYQCLAIQEPGGPLVAKIFGDPMPTRQLAAESALRSCKVQLGSSHCSLLSCFVRR